MTHKEKAAPLGTGNGFKNISYGPAIISPIQAFQAYAHDNGFNLPDVIADGQIHRFHVEGDKSGSKNGWYVLHLDGVPAGVFGTHKEPDITHKWRQGSGRPVSPRERREQAAQIKAAKRQREEEDRQRHDEAARLATDLWNKLNPVESFGYLTKKQIGPHGARLLPKPIRVGEQLVYAPALIVPLHDSTGEIKSLQSISETGRKTFLSGGEIQGNHYLIGDVTRDTPRLLIAEGFATGATLYEVMNEPVAVAFNCANLKPVAMALRRKYAAIEILICADNDRFTPGNPGITKARAAALAVGGEVSIPQFPEGDSGTDYNDLYRGEV